jgi:hypothetical protein
VTDRQPVGRIGFIAAVLITAATAVNVVAAWSDRAEVSVAGIIAFLVAGMFFLMWLWPARQNAEIMCAAPHRRSRVWLTLSWLVPVVSLWFPYQIVSDIHRASQPGNPRAVADLAAVPGSPLLAAWWVLWLVNQVSSTVVTFGGNLSDSTIGLLDVIGRVALVGAAVLIIVIIREISVWQRPVPG